MDRVSGKLTIYFEDPFWVGVFERIENRKLSAAKVTFGVEPKDYDVLEFINRNYYHLQFSPAVEYPSWDAQNMISVHLAEKLGYEYDHEYTAYEVSGEEGTHGYEL